MSHGVSTLNKQNKTKQKERKKVSKEKKYDDVIFQFDLSDELTKTVYDFVSMRNMIKKPMTNRALELMLKKLNDMSEDESVKKRILEQSIMNNWQGIFPLKEEQKLSKQSEENSWDTFMQEMKAKGEL